MQTVDKKYFLFNKGINTEAPLVAWPEGFTIDEQNFDLFIDGSRRRRPGLAPEITPIDPDVPEPEPPEPEPPVTECFDLYTTTADLSRTSADGFVIDPELQFTTEANKTYWMYGHLRFKVISNTGNPGIQTNFYHAGTTRAFQSMGTHAAQPQPSATVTAAARFTPIGLDGIGDSGYNYIGTLTNDYFYDVFIDSILVVGGSGGQAGVLWGIYNMTAAGEIALLEGSYITAIEIDIA